MDTLNIETSIMHFSYDWFVAKKDNFISDGLMSDLRNIDENLDQRLRKNKWNNSRYFKIDKLIEENTEALEELAIYCWNGSLLEATTDLFSNIARHKSTFPCFGIEVLDTILDNIHAYAEKFTDLSAINSVLKQARNSIGKAIESLLKIESDSQYRYVLKMFLKSFNTEISKKYSHIEEQLKLVAGTNLIELKLTKEVCEKIANIAVKNRKFVSSVEGGITEGEALYILLNPQEKKQNNIKIIVDHWINKDVFYLLYKLRHLTTESFVIADIEQKRMLYLKTGLLFSRATFDPFVSKKCIEHYQLTSKHRKIIDEETSRLFKS